LNARRRRRGRSTVLGALKASLKRTAVAKSSLPNLRPSRCSKRTCEDVSSYVLFVPVGSDRFGPFDLRIDDATDPRYLRSRSEMRLRDSKIIIRVRFAAISKPDRRHARLFDAPNETRGTLKDVRIMIGSIHHSADTRWPRLQAGRNN